MTIHVKNVISVRGNKLTALYDDVKNTVRMISNSKGGKFDKKEHCISNLMRTLGKNNNNPAFFRRIIESI